MNPLRHAWRNIRRNQRRSAITIAALSLTAAVLIITYALMGGLMSHTVANTTNMVLGEVQIHQKGYLADRSMYKSIQDPDRAMEKLRSMGIPAVGRAYGYGLAARSSKSAGALFWGVDPSREKTVFDLAQNMAQGRFLADRPEMGIVLGKKLAKSLGAEVGSEIVVVVQAADGSLGNNLYTVTGILRTAGGTIDQSAAIMHQKDFDDLFVADGRLHEIALNTRGAMPLAEVQKAAQSVISGGAEAETWRDLAPVLSDMLRMFDAFIWVFGFIFFLAGGLGVMNTMLMATFERIREFGVLKALGATPFRIMRDVAVEALVLAAVSTVIGAAIGLAGALYFQTYGLDTSSFAGGEYTISGVAFDTLWRADIQVGTIVWPIVIMWVVCFLASLYPAFLAARLDPVKAMNHV